MINMPFLIGAIVIMLIIIARDVMKKYLEIDMDKIDVQKGSKKWLRITKMIVSKYYNKYKPKSSVMIKKKSGIRALKMITAGDNKETVLATLRQITDIDYDSAKKIVNSTPMIFMENISDQEADMTKKALEFVGAKIEIV